jgi:hypothetical protein
MDLEQKLAIARERLDAAVKALAPKHMGGEWEAYRAAQTALLTAERELAASRNEEHAVPLEFPAPWDTGAPLPQLLVNDHRAFLIFLRRAVEPKPNGPATTAPGAAAVEPPTIAPGAPSNEPAIQPVAVVEFKRCMSAKLGSPNDEVFHNHPLSGKGLESYTAQLVRNSRWLAELQKVNSVHAGYCHHAWSKLNHYVFWFHDTTFECIAESFAVELRDAAIPELLAETCRRLVA